MKPELKRKWVKALLSGKYEQGTHYFESDGKFCCLGVLCVSMGVPTTVGYAGNWDAVDAVLPDASMHLADLNDEGVPFDMIAGLIDEAL